MLWLILNVIFLPYTLETYDKTRRDYFYRINHSQELTFIEKINIYGLNIFMSIVAIPIYPEASMESIYLIFPTENGYRTFNSNFFLNSNRIRETISKNPNVNKFNVIWNVSEYSFFQTEARYALALNPCEINKRIVNGETIFEVSVQIQYPNKMEVVLINKPVNLIVEEGLFAYLQKSGWLHPYTAIWIGKNFSNSPYAEKHTVR
ncbi:MAG: hypothetical protein IPL26_26215 [Leptospiraceae bacterium]|nr:hypothetical protein [Leptospiraceae bacterium]